VFGGEPQILLLPAHLSFLILAIIKPLLKQTVSHQLMFLYSFFGGKPSTVCCL
jgi:hypothetical protein